MPIFLDRHDVPGVTASEVAEVHQEDLKIQDKYDCQAFTYWFDEERGTAFCLIEAPDKKAVQEMHNEAHGLIPNQIIEVKSNIVQAFLGRIRDPESIDHSEFSDPFIFNDPAFRTIMVASLKNVSLIRSYPDPEKGHILFQSLIEIILHAIKEYEGRKAQFVDDGVIASFNSAVNSFQCASEIEKKFNKLNSKDPETDIQIAIGLSAGEPVTENDGLFGDVIQLAKRLSYITDSGQLLISSDVRDLCKRQGLRIHLGNNNIEILTPDDEVFINRLMDVAEESWNQEKFKVTDFSRKMGLSKSQLYRNIVRITGRSPSDFIKEFRLNKAIRLIEKRQGNIAQIAFETGFRNPSYFSKCFQKQFGILPSDYSKRLP